MLLSICSFSKFLTLIFLTVKYLCFSGLVEAIPETNVHYVNTGIAWNMQAAGLCPPVLWKTLNAVTIFPSHVFQQIHCCATSIKYLEKEMKPAQFSLDPQVAMGI